MMPHPPVKEMNQHPVKQMNQASWQIINGEYDVAIASFTNTLKTLKLALSGDAKILIPNEMNVACDNGDNDDDDDTDDNQREYEDQDQDEGDDYCMDVDDENDTRTVATNSSTRNTNSRSQSRLSSPSLLSSSSSSSSSSSTFRYDFFTSPSSSSFLKTAVAVAVNKHSNSNSNRYTKNRNDASTNSQQQHQLQISIFRHPILVHGDHFRSPLDVQVCEQLSYVAIYNLALSHHLKSVQLSRQEEDIEEARRERYQQQESSSSSSSSSLKSLRIKCNEDLRRVYLHKALQLYEHSHQILMKQVIHVGVPVIHSMALVSNLGQIHRALGDHHKAEMCMQYLLSTLMYVIDCGKVDTLGNSMDGFFNMIRPLISQHDPAPAA